MKSPVLDALLAYIEARIDEKIMLSRGFTAWRQTEQSKVKYAELKRIMREISGSGD